MFKFKFGKEKSVFQLSKLNKVLGHRSSQRDEARNERDVARNQRDEARTARDVSREQRDEARTQREEAKRESSYHMGQRDEARLNGSGATDARRKTPISTRFCDLGKINFFSDEGHRVKAAQNIKMSTKANSELTVTEKELFARRAAPKINNFLPAINPPSPNIGFLTVGNDRFLPGLEALVLSLLDVYPNFSSDFYIYHDGSISEFAQLGLKDIYSGLIFVEDEMEWLELGEGKSDNQRRIGKLGYMNINALKYSQYQHMVVLDSDLIIKGDISVLWSDSEAISVAPDIGDRAYASYSDILKGFVINSGVIAIPNKYLTDGAYKEIQSITENAKTPYCDLLDRFADQKAWNIFLKDKSIKFLPLNYNCNVKYVAKYLDGHTEALSIVHFAGPKPWLTKEYVEDRLVVKGPSKSVTYHELWRSTYRSLKLKNRLAQFERFSNESLRKEPCKSTSEVCLLVGNGPSLNKVEFSKLSSYEKITFNWFINYEGFDEVAPDHLVIGSHMFFGGWNIQDPSFPPEYLDKLRSKAHKPVIWTSFYFRNLFKILGLEDEFECNYLLFEKPFKNFIDHKGWTASDPNGFLDDGRTGILSFGIPMTKLLNYRDSVLLGCDSNYNRTGSEGNYFYANSEHTSLSTENESLTSTWIEGGVGQYCYEVVNESLGAEGRRIIDATIDGALVNIPKMDVEELY
jgi:lipopolysaccharide biosynthesis glycosyltransferase